MADLVGRVWVAAGFTPSAIRERIEAEHHEQGRVQPAHHGPTAACTASRPMTPPAARRRGRGASTPTPTVEAAAAEVEVEVPVEVRRGGPSGRETRQTMPRPCGGGGRCVGGVARVRRTRLR